ncbi:MAG TPA: cytochrome d ubiquinol oxidase subunit II [Gemmatimonadaceae bacterium]|nr:cytochrome d ubiquinol oxidase subunit II [Gemmatimonadaceae bacterium]
MITLPDTLAFLAVLALDAYALTGGADFGGGVWDLLASGPRRREQRALVADAIAPIWEANHVWLIIVVVLLFTCFPTAFAALGTVLHVPISILLVGIVLRGSAFTFRAYDTRRDGAQRRWGLPFAIASVITPVLLGVCIGALASGGVGRGMRAVAAGSSADFGAVYVDSWLTPFAFAVGLMALALFAFLAATYLTLEAPDGPLREDFRTRALGAALAVFVTAAGALLLSHASAPRMAEALVRGPLAIPVHIATAAAALTAIGALWTRRYRLARAAAAAQTSLILWGWAVAQYPYVIPDYLSIADAAAPPVTLRLTLIGLAGGALVLVPSLWYLFRVFKGTGTAFERVDAGRPPGDGGGGGTHG